MKHNPTKLDEIPKLLEKYRGHEDELIRKLEKKYGISSPVASVFNANRGFGTQAPQTGQMNQTFGNTTSFGGNTTSFGGSNQFNPAPTTQFGNSTGSPFGGTAGPGGSPFGATAGPATGSPFGSTAATMGSPFGGTAGPGGSPFGVTAGPTTGSPFGNAAGTSSFGSTPTTPFGMK